MELETRPTIFGVLAVVCLLYLTGRPRTRKHLDSKMIKSENGLKWSAIKCDKIKKGT